MVNQSPHQAVNFSVLMPHAPVLVPALGDARADFVAGTVQAMREASRRLVDTNPEALVLVSPHSPRQPGRFGIWDGKRLCGTFAAFGAPWERLELPADRQLADAIFQEASARGLAMWKIAGHELDHGAVVPLWFIVEAGWNGPTVVLSLNYPGEPGAVDLGEALACAAARCGTRVAMVASGDMSHRLTPGSPAGYDPRAEAFDRWLIRTIDNGDYRSLREADPELEQLAGEDALDSVLIAAGATGFDATGHDVLSYEGPFGVGYGVAILHDTASAGARQKLGEASCSH
jgi:aromatic ring-opening dioxygenase LigB subunit